MIYNTLVRLMWANGFVKQKKLMKCFFQFELYLKRWKIDESIEKHLLAILRRPSLNEDMNTTYDRNHALILCSTYEFWPGVMHIYEEKQLLVEC